MNKNRSTPQTTSNAEYQRDYAKRKKDQKAARFKKLVKMAEPLKEALKKYRPENQPPPKPPEKQQQPGAGLVNNPARQQPQRKRWILGVD